MDSIQAETYVDPRSLIDSLKFANDNNQAAIREITRLEKECARLKEDGDWENKDVLLLRLNALQKSHVTQSKDLQELRESKAKLIKENAELLKHKEVARENIQLTNSNNRLKIILDENVKQSYTYTDITNRTGELLDALLESERLNCLMFLMQRYGFIVEGNK